MSSRLGHDFSMVRVHTDAAASRSAVDINARAYTAGPHVVFRAGEYQPSTLAGQRVLAHELTHVVQERHSASTGSLVLGDPYSPAEAEAERVAESAERELQASQAPTSQRLGDLRGGDRAGVSVGPEVLQRHPAEKVLRFAAKWLSKRTAKQITKHIARHTRAIAGRAIHSVFRNPRAVKYTVTRAIREATEVVQRHATTAVTQVVEEGTIRVTRQATRSPGKYRWVLEKTFIEPIGTAGERILRIVIDQTGRIVTAFPSDRLMALGLTAAGIEAFTARTAEAAETVSASVEKQAALEKAASEPRDTSWWEWVPIVGDIWGGELNSGESQQLTARDEAQRRDKIVQDVVADAIVDIEADLQASLGPEQRADVEEFVRMVLATGLDVSQEEW